MKKVFTLGFLLLGLTASAQQVNGSFDDEWVDCYPWEKGNQVTRAYGTTPQGWIVSNVPNTMVGSVAKQVTEEGQEGSAVMLTNQSASGQKIPAYISLGTTWATAETRLTTVRNADGGDFGGIDFSYKPDGIRLNYKRDQSKGEERAAVIAYIWNGTWTQADVPSNTAVGVLSYGTATKVPMTDRDRNILGLETALGGEVTKTDDAQLIASLESYITEQQDEWATLTATFNYGDQADADVSNAKLNIIISANDYFGDRNGIVANNSLTIDNVELIYNSQLAELKYNGATVAGFDKDTYNYTIDEFYEEGSVEAVKNCVGGSLETAYDNESAVLTITVKGDDWSEENQNQHVYTIQFRVDIHVEEANPAPTEGEEDALESLNEIKLTFNKPVKLNEEGEHVITLTNKLKSYTLTASVEGATVTLTTDEEVAGGKYTLTVPKNTFVNLNGACGNAAYNAEYYVVKPVTVVIDPADGVAQTSLSRFTLTFEGAEVVGPAFGTESGDIQILKGEEVVATVTKDDVKNETDASLPEDFLGSIDYAIISLPEAITENGTYTLNIPAEFFEVGDGKNEELTFTYTVSNISVTGITPEPFDIEEGNTLEALETITVTFSEAVELNDAEKVMLTGFPMGSYECDIQVAGNTVTLTPKETLGEGRYTLVIDEGAFKSAASEDVVNLSYFATYMVEIPLNVEVSIAPEAGEVTSLSHFELSFDVPTQTNYGAIELRKEGEEEPLQAINVFMLEGSDAVMEPDWWDPSEEILVGYKKFSFDLLEAVKEDGTYTLYIPEGTFVYQVEPSFPSAPEMTFTYTVVTTDAIAGVFAEAGLVDVYTVSGVCVKKNATADDLKALKKGLYIIGGKKVIIK